MAKRSPRRRSKKRFNKLLFIPAAIIVLVVGLFSAVIYFSPKGLSDRSDPDNQPVSSYGQEVEDLEPLLYFEKFEKLYKKNQVTEQDYQDLSQQVKDLEQFIFVNPSLKHLVDLDYAKFKKIHDDYFAKFIYNEIEDLIQASGELERSGKLEQSYTYMQKAWDRQKEIHEDYSASEFVNYNRLTNLEVEATRLKAKPYLVRLEDAEAKSKVLISEGNFIDALAEILIAKEMQEFINRNHGDSIYVDTQRLIRLDVEAQRIQSGTLSQQVKELLAQSEESIDADQPQEAAAQIRKAIDLQEEIHRSYPQSPFVDTQFLLELESRRQTARGIDDAKSISEGAGIMRDLLRRDDVEGAMSFADSLENQLIAYESNFPRSLFSIEDVWSKIKILKDLQSDLIRIHQLVDADLVKVVSYQEIYLSKIEVSQELYRLVMKSNPSRKPGDRFPVEAVTFEEALRFCERLSGVLGEKVRLPTVEEWKEWASYGADKDISSYAWFSGNAAAQTHEVGRKEPNAKGLYDTVGNVSEWLENQLNDKNQAAFASANYLSTPDEIQSNVISTGSPNERSRWRGFRFVVEKELF